MKKILLWGTVTILALLAFGIYTIFFAWLFQTPPAPQAASTPTPAPTFTPTPTPTGVILAAVTPPTATPSPTPTPTPSPTNTPTPLPTNTPTLAIPQVVASTAVNIRSGPGINYPVVDTLLPNHPLTVTGRNQPATWWQVQRTDGAAGWVANSVVAASAVEGVPVAEAPPPPEPTPTPVPPTPTRPPYQYEPTGWWSDTNYGLTRFMGTITDVNGNPVNGVYVEAQCGTYHVISNPSGPVAGSLSNDSVNDPPGFYDITLGRRPIPCKWHLAVVASEDGGRTASARLSEPVLVETTIDESIIVANWRKNW